MMQQTLVLKGHRAELQLPTLFRRFDLAIPYSARECADLIENENKLFFDLSVWKKAIDVYALENGYAFRITEYGRILPRIEAVGHLVSDGKNETQVMGSAKVAYGRHLILWGLVVLVTLWFALAGNSGALNLMLAVNVVMAGIFGVAMRRCHRLVGYIQETLNV